ncbi:hypothetical protein [Pseudorhodoplanes sp.]|uniref:hypothetical protein n=1 Tax=Pseudorhodoplanes sp. TaxID=1934341 RepID=UPI003D0D581C
MDIDGRSAIARRYKDIIAAHVSDLGGADHLSEAQLTLIRRVATLTVVLEQMDSEFAIEDGVKDRDFELYQRGSNTLRRLLETLGTTKGRKAKLVNEATDLNEYLRSKRNGRVRILDMEAAE